MRLGKRAATSTPLVATGVRLWEMRGASESVLLLVAQLRQERTPLGDAPGDERRLGERGALR
jgi:hypothetical protein